VLAAFAAVARHLFLPDVAIESAYCDEAIVTRRDEDGRAVSSSSQPAMMAIMLDQLGLAPGQRVLEVGAGTGYNAALMARLVAPGGEVVTVDIDADVADGARDGLARAGYPDVHVVCGDGAAGCAERAPYDRIIATVGVWDLSPAWLAQLAPGGRIVVPLDLGGPQLSVALEAEDGHWASRSVVPCGFMRLRGDNAGPERTEVVNPDSDLMIMLPRGGDLDRDEMLTALAGAPVLRRTDVEAGRREVLGGLGLWLAAGEGRWCVLSESDTAGSPLLPETALRVQDRRVSAGLWAPEGIALLGAEGETLIVLGYGPGGAELATTLAEQVRTWQAAGRPGSRGLRVAVHPRSTSDGELTGHHILDKTHTRLAVSWAG